MRKDFSNSYTVPQSEAKNFALYKHLKNALRNMLNGEGLLQTLNSYPHARLACMRILNDMLICGYMNSMIKIWDLKTGMELQTRSQCHRSGIECITIWDGKLITGSDDGTIKIWDLNTETEKELMTLGHPKHQSNIYCIKLWGDKLISGSLDNTIRIWDLKTGKELLQLKGHKSAIYCLELWNNKLISGSADKTIRIWDLETGKELLQLKGHAGEINCMKIWNDKLITSFSNKTIKVWDLNKRLELMTLNGHEDDITYLTILDGMIISASKDKTIRIWDLDIGLELEGIAHEESILCAEFLDGRLIFGSEDQTIQILDFNTLSFKEIAEENLPILLIDLGIVTLKECSEKLGCTPDDLSKRGICSAEDLQALYLQALPNIEFPDFQYLQITAEEATQDLIQLQKRAFDKKKIVIALLDQLFAAAQKNADATKPYTLRHDNTGAVYHVLNPWVAFQEKLTKLKAALNANGLTKDQFLQKFNPASYAALVKEVNALIDEFHTSCKREMQILVLHAYLNQWGILKRWIKLNEQEEGIGSLAALLKTDKAPQDILHMGK